MVEQKSPFDRTIAVVIGINDYQNGINSLKTAVPDAAAIADLLKTKQGYEIFPEVILNAAATCDRLKTLLKEELPKQVGKGDRVLVYFAGHGVALDGHDGPEGYLVPQNAKPGDKGSMLPMQMLHDELAKLDCRHLLLILDCCFAGAFRWSANYRDVGLEEDLYEQQYQRFIKQPAWQIITSAGADERAIDVLALRDHRGQIGNHSPFAQVLLDALAGTADRYPAAKNGGPAGDGVITANELITYIESEFSERLQDQQTNQTPGLWCFRKHGNGRYIFNHPDHPRNLKNAPPLDKSTNPYRGLASFEKEHKDLFFGRSELTDILTEFVKQRALTVVLGTSGSGKSSLVKAGLIPHIEALQNGERWAILPFRPEHSPFASLNQVLGERGLPKIKNPLQPNSLEPATDPEHSLEQTLSAWLQAHSDTQLLVVIDQFEELVTLSGSKERLLFLEILANAIVKYDKQLHLVITLRSDFEPQFKESPLAPFWNNANFFITTPMSRADLRQAIEKPADKRTFFFESKDPENSLVDRLINEVEGMPGALPLLSFALSELYLKYLGRQEAARGGPPINRAITEADYQALGSVQQSITKRADEIYNQLCDGEVSDKVLEKVRQKFRESSHVDVDSVEHQLQQICQSGVSDRVIRNVMLRMVSTTGIARSRRPVQCSELEYPEPDCIQVAIVLETFEQERLLTTDKDAAGNAYIEPAHDALILNWSKINLWLNERQDRVEPKPQFALLPALKATLKLTAPVSQKISDVAPDLSAKPASLQSEDLLKVNLELQRELTISANKWESARKYESEVKSQTKKNEEGQTKKAVNWLWADDPRLPIVGRIYRSTDIWLNKVEAEFVQCSLQKRQNNHHRLIGFLSIVILALSGFAFFASYQWRKSEIQQINALSETSTSQLLSHQELEAVTTSLQIGKALKQSFWQAIWPDSQLENQVKRTLQKVLYGVKEHNRLQVGSPIAAVAFSPNDQMIATVSLNNGTAQLWQPDGLSIPWPHNGQKVLVTSSTHQQKSVPVVALSADRRMVALNDGGRLLLFFQTKEGMRQIPISVVAFNPIKKIVALGVGDRVLLLSLEGDRPLSSLEGRRGSIAALAFSGDGQTLATANMEVNKKQEKIGTVQIWKVENRTLLKTLEGDMKGVQQAVAISPDAQMVAASGWYGATVWKSNGTWHKKLEGHSGAVNTISFSPNSQMIATGSVDKTIKLWKRDGALSQTLVGHGDAVWGVSFRSDSQMVASASNDNTVKLWQIDGTLVQTLNGHQNVVRAVAFGHNNNTLASAGDDGTVKIWQLGGSSLKALLHNDQAYAVAFSPDGKTIATTSGHGWLTLWNPDGTLQKTEKRHGGPTTAVAFSPNGEMIATTAGDRSVQIWNSDSTPTKYQYLEGHWGETNQYEVMGLSFSPDSQTVVTASVDGTVQLFKTYDGKLLKTLDQQSSKVWGVSFNPNGQMIASANDDGTVKLWTKDGKFLLVLKGHEAAVVGVAFSPDGKTIASASADKTVKLWNSDDGKLLTTLNGHNNAVRAVAFSPNGQIIASASYDGTVKLWERDGTLLKTLSGHEAAVVGVAFSPDGKTIASASSDKIVLLWNWEENLDLDQLLAYSCQWAGDYIKNNPNVDKKNGQLCLYTGQNNRRGHPFGLTK